MEPTEKKPKDSDTLPEKEPEKEPWTRTQRLVIVGFIVTAVLVWVFSIDKPAEFKNASHGGPNTESDTPQSGEVKADSSTWSTAEMLATCSSTSHTVPAYTIDGKNKKQVTLNCTVMNRTDRTVPLAAFNKTDALFKDSTGRIIRGTAYLAGATPHVPAHGEIQAAGLYLGHDDCPAQQPDVDCVKSELMDSRELLLRDTTTGTRYDVHIE
jgi:hypothetical protein